MLQASWGAHGRFECLDTTFHLGRQVRDLTGIWQLLLVPRHLKSTLAVGKVVGLGVDGGWVL